MAELLKDSKKSDREIAQILGVSQPTVSRMRSALHREGIIRGYTVEPDFAKLGFEIMAVTIAKAQVTLTPTQQERAKKLVLDEPRVIFVAGAEGMGRNGVMISFHKDYSDFMNFMNNLKSNSEGYMEQVDSMLISLQSNAVVKPLSFSYLAKREDG